MSSEEFESCTCPICTEIYNSSSRRPLLLANCGHSLCEKCFSQVKRAARSRGVFSSVICPLCRKPVSSAHPPVNFQLMSVVEEMKEMRRKLAKMKSSRNNEEVKENGTSSRDRETGLLDRRTVSFYNFPSHLTVDELYSFFDSIAAVKIDWRGPLVHLDRFNDNGQGAGTVVFESAMGADRSLRELRGKMYPGTTNKMIVKYAAVQNLQGIQASEPPTTSFSTGRASSERKRDASPMRRTSRDSQPSTSGGPHSTSTSRQPHSTSTSRQPHSTSTSRQPHSTSASRQPHSTSTSGQPHSTSTSRQPHSTSTRQSEYCEPPTMRFRSPPPRATYYDNDPLDYHYVRRRRPSNHQSYGDWFWNGFKIGTNTLLVLGGALLAREVYLYSNS